MAASGLAGYESVSLSGVLAPSRTPATIISRLNQEIVRALNRSEVKERLFGMGMEVIPGSPDEFAATIRHEMAKWGKLIREARLRE
jgi:tripartite-type tricarboxylate transporter receptor subunit TctC